MNEKLAPPTTPPGIGLGLGIGGGYEPPYVTSSSAAASAKATEAGSGLYRFASPRKQQQQQPPPRSAPSSRKASSSGAGGAGVAADRARACCPCFGCDGGGGAAGGRWQDSFWPALLANIGICALLVGYVFIGSFVFLTIENSASALDEGGPGASSGAGEEPLATRHLADVFATEQQQQQQLQRQQQHHELPQQEPQLMASTLHTLKDNATKVGTSLAATTTRALKTTTTSAKTTTKTKAKTVKTTTTTRQHKRRRRRRRRRGASERATGKAKRERDASEEDEEGEEAENQKGGEGEQEDEDEDEERQRTVENIWDITVSLNILYKENWTKLAALEIQKFQDQLVKRLAMDLTLSTSGERGVATASGRRPFARNANNNNNNNNDDNDDDDDQQPPSPWSHRPRLSGGPGRAGSAWGPRGRQHGHHQQQQQHFEWNFATAFLYSLTVITTVGYGSIAPRTTLGRMVTIGYATLGIPLTLVYLSSIGAVLARLARLLCSRALCRCRGRCCRCRCDAGGGGGASSKERELRLRRLQHLQQQQQQKQQQHLAYCYVRPPQDPPTATATPLTTTTTTTEELRMLEASLDTLSVATATTTGSRGLGGAVANPFGWSLVAPVGLCLLLMLAYVAFGAVAVALLEDWPLLDGVYFCVMSLTTIGFCDLLPGLGLGLELGETQVAAGSRERSLASVWFCAVYILSGLTLTAMCVNVLHEEILLRMRVVVKFKKVAVAARESKERSFYGPPP